MRVVVRCRATLYERDGAFQVYVNEMFPDGLGAAQLALEQLKARLEKEGLFDPAHKKPCTVTGHSSNRTDGQRRLITLRISCSAAPVLLVTTPIHLGYAGSGFLCAGSNRPSFSSRAFSCSSAF